MSMFCYQCEQTAKGTGCTVKGVCGKDPETAALQDLLLYATKGLAQCAAEARRAGKSDPEVDHFILEALFTTVTNVNFDAARIDELVLKAAALKEKVRRQTNVAALSGPAAWQPATDRAGRLRQAEEISTPRRQDQAGKNLVGLQELVLYGLKGMAAYAHHALVLGQSDNRVFAFFTEALATLARGEAKAEELLKLALRVGEMNLRVMELLDAANTGAYGNPTPTKVRITAKAGKAILVSGHDLKDLEEILKQTAGKGINVYTHGEMLPAHGYPELKKHPHLAGNYGSAWQLQRQEFETFPGAIVMTTNCIQAPKESYKARIFTRSLVAWPGVTHLPGQDYSPVIQAALAAPGFSADEPEKTILVGFGHHAVLGVADKVIAAVKAGKIKRFFLIGGCDGANPGRDYYTEFAETVPRDCVIMTLACGKYRFNKLDFGDIDGIPRLLDLGQCNDAYSAIRIAVALAEAFKCTVNELPLSLILSWYEQKAVVILLTLLHLGIRNIRLGITLPAFVTEPALKILVEQFGLKPLTGVKEDLAAALAGK